MTEWPSGLGEGLQNPLRGFNSLLRLKSRNLRAMYWIVYKQPDGRWCGIAESKWKGGPKHCATGSLEWVFSEIRLFMRCHKEMWKY